MTTENAEREGEELSSNAPLSPKKHVSFDEAAITADGHGRLPPPRPRHGGGRPRIKIGSGKATPLRNLFFMLVFVALLLVLTSDRFTGRHNDKPVVSLVDLPNDNPRSSVWQTLRDKLDRQAQEYIESNRRRAPCRLYLAPTSIPGNAGWGLFAGEQHDVGDVVLEHLFWLPLYRANYVLVSPYTFLLKHHPMLYNLEGSIGIGNSSSADEPMLLRASTTIRPGDELFVSSDSWNAAVQSIPTPLRSVFATVPSPEQYQHADTILADAVSTERRMRIAQNRRKQGVDTGFLFGLVHRTAARFDPILAFLLPHDKVGYNKRLNGPSALITLRNQTLKTLQIGGMCLSDVEIDRETGKDLDTKPTVVAARDMIKGAVVGPAPMHIVGSRDSCAQYCFAAPQRRDLGYYCPLSTASLVSSLDDDDDNNSAINVAWQPSMETKKLEELSDDELTKMSCGTILWKLVALRDIAKGERVRLLDLIFSAVAAHRCKL